MDGYVCRFVSTGVNVAVHVGHKEGHGEAGSTAKPNEWTCVSGCQFCKVVVAAGWLLVLCEMLAVAWVCSVVATVLMSCTLPARDATYLPASVIISPNMRNP